MLDQRDAHAHRTDAGSAVRSASSCPSPSSRRSRRPSWPGVRRAPTRPRGHGRASARRGLGHATARNLELRRTAGSRPRASRMVSANLAGSAVSRHISGTPGSRCSSPTLRPSAVCGSITHSIARRRGGSWRAGLRGCSIPTRIRSAPRARNPPCRRGRTRRRREASPQLRHPRRIAPDQVEHVALEVGRLGNVHGRAEVALTSLDARAPVAAGAEELVEHVVLVGGEDQAAIGRPILRAMWPAQMLPKLPEGTANETGSPSRDRSPRSNR